MFVSRVNDYFIPSLRHFDGVSKRTVSVGADFAANDNFVMHSAVEIGSVVGYSAEQFPREHHPSHANPNGKGRLETSMIIRNFLGAINKDTRFSD